MTMTIHEAVKMINEGKSQRQTAKEYGKSESTLRGHIEKAGYVRDDENKYILSAESEETNVSAETSFSQEELTAENNLSQKEVSAENNETTNEEKNSRTNEGIRVKIKEAPQKPNKEEKTAMRKRASFDINADLLKRLRVFAILADKNAYEIVEQAIKEYLDKQEGK
jgi:hypothetical protein